MYFFRINISLYSCGYNEVSMITVEEAFKLVKNNITPNEKTILIELNNSLGYVLALDVFSPINMPPFRQSAMDGYALNLHNKSNYKIIDEIKAGD